MSSRQYHDLQPPTRLLLGPGPSNVDPRVLRAMAAPLLGHLDPEFLKIMDETKQLLQYAFQTENYFTLPVSGTGSAGMEAALCSVIQPGDKVLVGTIGYFGARICEIVARCRGQLTRIDAQWGTPLDQQQLHDALKQGDYRVVALVHAETSTGVLQPLEEISRMVHEHNALFLVDAVTSLGGCPLKVDDWSLDVVYSGTQKCVGSPPGLAPITFSARAEQVMNSRESPVQSWYLDMSLVRQYWGQERFYHHTAPISMCYALREALRLLYEEGIETRWCRHETNYRALAAGLQALGLQLLVSEPYRLPSLTTVSVPAGIDDARVRGRLLQDYNIEIGGGLGELKGRIWRIGLMGFNSSRTVVLTFLAALAATLNAESFPACAKEAVQAAERAYSTAA